MNKLEKEILKIISEHPGIKAKDIAQFIDLERKEVNYALYGILKGYCYQDSSYRWYLNAEKDKRKINVSSAPSDIQLSNICKYYLNCLSLEENNGISEFLTSKYDLKYVELSSISVDNSDENVDKLIRKVSIDKKMVAHVGYPVMIKKIHSIKNNKDYLKISPVFLFPVEISGGEVNVASIPPEFCS